MAFLQFLVTPPALSRLVVQTRAKPQPTIDRSPEPPVFQPQPTQGNEIMKRRIKTVVAITTLALTASASISAEACDRGGRRISLSRGPIGSPFSPFNHYSKPTYSQPVYAQPQVVYQQQVQSLPPSQVSTFPVQNIAPQQQPTSSAMLSGQPGTIAPANTMPRTSAVPQQAGQQVPQQAPAAAPRTVANNRAPVSSAATQPQSTPASPASPASQASQASQAQPSEPSERGSLGTATVGIHHDDQ